MLKVKLLAILKSKMAAKYFKMAAKHEKNSKLPKMHRTLVKSVFLVKSAAILKSKMAAKIFKMAAKTEKNLKISKMLESRYF